ncbi:hypothetical protein DFP72DRAFT_844552 [Ephemerocybe angulata]|uniref:Uncharacterized protein n=1 Tax=Ephemerocybe angulata TaxID=980116 RepID=A0A8H6MBQ6_9AGAR|nr:hypothetical protein DFP72DRAFT_844552 [Tulosesus angulatus]
MWVMMSKARRLEIILELTCSERWGTQISSYAEGERVLDRFTAIINRYAFSVPPPLSYARWEPEKERGFVGGGLALFGSRFVDLGLKVKSTVIEYIRQHEPSYEGFPVECPPLSIWNREDVTAHDQGLDCKAARDGAIVAEAPFNDADTPGFALFEYRSWTIRRRAWGSGVPASLYRVLQIPTTPNDAVASINPLIALLPPILLVPTNPISQPTSPAQPPNENTHDNGDNPAAQKGGRSARSEEREGGGEVVPGGSEYILRCFILRPPPLLTPTRSRTVRYDTTTTATRKGEPAYHLRLFPMQPPDATAYELGADEHTQPRNGPNTTRRRWTLQDVGWCGEQSRGVGVGRVGCRDKSSLDVEREVGLGTQGQGHEGDEAGCGVVPLRLAHPCTSRDMLEEGMRMRLPRGTEPRSDSIDITSRALELGISTPPPAKACRRESGGKYNFGCQAENVRTSLLAVHPRLGGVAF